MNALKLVLLRTRFVTAVLLALPLLAFTSGCLVIAAGAAGAGTVAFIRGELDATVSANLPTTTAAVDRALSQLQFVKVNSREDALSAVVNARTAQDKKIAITLNKTADNLTRIRIRVGVFGDESVSRALLDRIKTNL
jgi:hypothetical protein